MSLGNVLGAVAPIAAGYFAPSTMFGGALGATGSAIATGALTGAGIAALSGQDILTGGVMGGLGGLGGGGLRSAADATKAAAAGVGGGTTAGVNAITQAPLTGSAEFISPFNTAGNFGYQTANSALGNVVNTPLPPLQGTLGSNYPNFSVGSTSGGNVALPPLKETLGSTYQGALGPNFDVAGKALGSPSPNFNAVTGGGGYDPTLKGTLDRGVGSLSEGFDSAQAAFDNPSAFLENLGDGDKVIGAGKLALTSSGPVMAAFEPETQSFDELRTDKYDPTRRLNLDEIDTGIGAALKRDTGLRLIKEGGHIKGYKGGGPLSRLLESGNTQGTMTNTSTGQATDMSGQSMLDMLRRAGVVKYEDGGEVTPVTSGESYDSLIASGVHPMNAMYAAGFTAKELGYTPEGFKPTTGLGKGETPGTDAYAAGLDVPPGTELTAEGKYIYPIIPSYYYSGAPRRAFTPSSPGSLKSLKDMAAGGMRTTTEATMAGGGYLETGGRVGDGMSDDIKARINNQQEARLSDGEFVLPADVVSHLGNGSSDAGAKRLYSMMDRIRQARTGNSKQGKEIKAERYMPA